MMVKSDFFEKNAVSRCHPPAILVNKGVEGVRRTRKLPFSLFSATDFPIFGKEIGQTGGAVATKHKEFLKIVRKLRTKRQKKADIPGVDKINEKKTKIVRSKSFFLQIYPAWTSVLGKIRFFLRKTRSIRIFIADIPGMRLFCENHGWSPAENDLFRVFAMFINVRQRDR